MRRIYESDAVTRDDDDPFAPNERDGRRATADISGERYRSINWERFSHAFMPVALRDRGVSVSVDTPKDTYEIDERVTLQVKMENRYPLPVTLRTNSPVGWWWAVDGAESASQLESELPDDGGLLRFRRGERKYFEREWNQLVRVREREWEPVRRGEHRLSAGVDVGDAEGRGLRDETTIRIE